MKHYRPLPIAVYRAEQRLEVVTAAWGRDEGTTLADVARDHKISVALVTKLQRLAREALVPKAPGPKPRPAAVAVETAAPPFVATTGLSLDGDDLPFWRRPRDARTSSVLLTRSPQSHQRA